MVDKVKGKSPTGASRIWAKRLRPNRGHRGLEKRQRKARKVLATKVKVYAKDGEVEFLGWRKGRRKVGKYNFNSCYKPCPNRACKETFTRDDSVIGGCNEMSCLSCGISWCLFCGRFLDEQPHTPFAGCHQLKRLYYPNKGFRRGNDQSATSSDIEVILDMWKNYGLEEIKRSTDTRKRKRPYNNMPERVIDMICEK